MQLRQGFVPDHKVHGLPLPLETAVVVLQSQSLSSGRLCLIVIFETQCRITPLRLERWTSTLRDLQIATQTHGTSDPDMLSNPCSPSRFHSIVVTELIQEA